jgi:hypothetical protein
LDIGSHTQIRNGDTYHVKAALKATQVFDLYEYLPVIATPHKAYFTNYRTILTSYTTKISSHTKVKIGSMQVALSYLAFSGNFEVSRSKPQKSAARKLLKKPKGKLIPIDLASTNHPEWMTRVYKNNRYIVMIDDNAGIKGVAAIKAMVQRHDDKPIPGHWREPQDIKNEIFGSEAMAVEFYPPESEFTDVANIYWLWIIQPYVQFAL